MHNKNIKLQVTSIDPDLQTKTSGGRVGLKNMGIHTTKEFFYNIFLGNTCYLNSMIQALYMSVHFRNKLLSKISQNKLCKELQRVFAYLYVSQRSCIQPSGLVYSLPSYYQIGIQQDTSEFVKANIMLYLLFTP